MYKLYVSRYGAWEHWGTYSTVDRLAQAVWTLRRQSNIEDVRVEECR
jgi:hypothetical protein